MLHIQNVTSPKDDPAGSGADLGPLPEWNLRDLYSAPDGADLKADFTAVEKRATAFEAHRGKVAALSSAALKPRKQRIKALTIGGDLIHCQYSPFDRRSD